MKYYTVANLLLLFLMTSCTGNLNDCTDKFDNEVPKRVDEEIIYAKDQIIENIELIYQLNIADRKLIGQDAGKLANIDLRIWNLIDGGLIESIVIKNEDLILFEIQTNSCTYKEEYIVHNTGTAEDIHSFKNLDIRVDSIQNTWWLVRVMKEQIDNGKNKKE